MATAVKSQIVASPGCSKPPVPPKPLPGDEKQSIKKKSHISPPSEAPPPPPTGDTGHLNQALALAQQLRLKNLNLAKSSSDTEAKPSTSQTDSSKKPDPGLKRSQSTDAKGKPKYVLKPLRQHHSFQEKTKKQQPVKRTSRDEGTSSKCRDWLCLPLASFVVKTKAGGTALVEKGKGRFFGKAPPPPKKLKRPAPAPPEDSNLVLTSRPKVPPRPILQRILAGLDNGKTAGEWHKLENVKYIDEEVSTEDSTDYTDVDWGQAIHSEPGDETIIYYTFLEEGPNEKVIFYRRIGRDQVLSSTDEEEDEEENKSRHVAEMESMEIGVVEPSASPFTVNGVKEDHSGEELIPDEQVPSSQSPIPESTAPHPPVEVEVHIKSEARVESPIIEMHQDLSVIEEEEEPVRKAPPPPRPPSPKYPTPARSSSPRFPSLSRSPSPILRMLSRSPSPKQLPILEEKPVIIYEKYETKVKIVEQNIGEPGLPLVDQPVPAVVENLPEVEKNVPEYARVQKYSPPKIEVSETPNETSNAPLTSEADAPAVLEIGETRKNEPYYDLDVAETPQIKTKPKRPPRPAQTPTPPPPPPKLVPPPVPPKTYMKIRFPPEKNGSEVGDSIFMDEVQLEQVIETMTEMPVVEEMMQATSRSHLGETGQNDLNGNIEDEKKELMEETAEEAKQMPEGEDVHLRSHLSLGGSEVSDEKVHLESGVLNETSESGFLSSPTPPPRHRKKRFRSMEGPVRGSTEEIGIPLELPIRRSKSMSDAESHTSQPRSTASMSQTSRDKVSTIKPKRPPRPALKPKPERPPKPPATTLKQIAKCPTRSESDVASVISSADGSPPLIRMKARPLPAPPAPPRHRHPSKTDKEGNVETKSPAPTPISSNFAFEFLAKLSEIEAGKLNLNEINVKKIKVQEIEADVVKAGKLHVGVITPLVLVKGKADEDDSDHEKPRDKSADEKDSLDDQDSKPPPDWWEKASPQQPAPQGGREESPQQDAIQEKETSLPEEVTLEANQQTPREDPETMTQNMSQEMEESFKTMPQEETKIEVFEGDSLEEVQVQVSDRLIVTPVAVPGGVGSSIFYTGEEEEEGEPIKRRSPTPSTVSSGKSSKKKQDRQTSWYDEGIIPGQSGDIDTSDGRAEGGIDSPSLVTSMDNIPVDSDSDAKKFASLSSVGGRTERKKSGRPGRGSLQLYPREESPSSSSTTDAEHDDPKGQRHRGSRTRSLSAGYTASPSAERRLPQLDPNANYCEDESYANPNLPKPCSDGGRCGTPEQSGHDSTSTIEGDTCSKSVPVHDSTKRLSLLSIPTSEDSWYNCTSGDESESEGSFSTAASCQDNASIASDVSDTRRTKKYFIARELMTSERVFVDTLKLLNEDFRNVVMQANEEQKVIPVAVLDQILNYLPQLQNLNQDLLKDLQERIKNWEQTDHIADVITKKGPFLKLYSAYIKDFEMLTSSLDEACRKYPAFAQVVKDFEMSDRCNKLALKHFMLKPVQRIPQYKLLLQEYLKHLGTDSTEYEETVAALNIVTDVANHANQTMKQGDNFAKLLQIQNSIVGGGYEVIRPGRAFLKEGELSKLSRKVMQPRWFILFNDALLHTDIAQGSLRLHHELPLSGMRVSVPTNEEYLNEFSVISSTRSFTLSASSPHERDEWFSALNNAIKANAQRRGTFVSAVDKSNVGSQDEVNSTLGKNAPVWIPDSRVTMCQSCITPFTVTFRRHHCRACGKVVCATCSANRAPLQYLKFQSARVCDECFFKLAEAFDNTASESDCSTERASHSESGEGSDAQRANLRAQFKRFATGGGGKKPERRLPKVLKEVGANHQGAAISGYLHKKTKKGWRRYWFVINDKVLYTYKASEDVAALESIPLLGFDLKPSCEVFEGGDSNLGFQLLHPTHHSLVFFAENEAAAEKWKKEMHLATLL